MAHQRRPKPGAITVRVVARTDTGHVRSKNEDAFVVADLTGGTVLAREAAGGRFEVGDAGLLVAVSDGMGGAHAGEVASALVLHTLTRALAKPPPAGVPTDARFHAAVQKAHAKVWARGEEEGSPMGATLTAVYLEGGTAFIAEVGDSRAYLLRSGEIAQLTRDQTLVEELVRAGSLSAEEAEQSEFRHVILQAMGHQATVKVALARLDLRARDCLVLCSDGLTRHASDDEIRDTILTTRDLDTACARLVELALGRGGQDNVTVVLAGLSGRLAPASPREGIGRTYEVLQSFD
jgi:serine/threonine protein phosphatase PrpC